MAKEVGLDQHLNYDQNLKYSFIDHFYSLDTSLENVYKVTCYEAGDFFNQPYESKISEKNSAIQLAFERKGQLTFTGGIFPLDLKKIITLKKDSHLLKADYKITNTGLQPVAFIFGIEFNFALLAGNADDRYYYIPEMILQQKNLASLGENHDIPEIGLKDHWLKVDCNLKFSVPADIWRYPVETVSNSEAGYERVYQCSTVIPHWRIELQPGASWSATIQKDTRHFK
jgi:alpha-amylase